MRDPLIPTSHFFLFSLEIQKLNNNNIIMHEWDITNHVGHTSWLLYSALICSGLDAWANKWVLFVVNNFKCPKIDTSWDYWCSAYKLASYLVTRYDGTVDHDKLN